MGNRQLDGLARALAAPVASRRAACRCLATTVLALLPTAAARYRAAAGGPCRAAGKPCRRSGQCCPGARCRDGKCGCRSGYTRIAGRCGPKCNDGCGAPCTGCAYTYEQDASFCSGTGGGCAGLGALCASHADCAANELCTYTTCGPDGATEFHCQAVCVISNPN